MTDRAKYVVPQFPAYQKGSKRTTIKSRMQHRKNFLMKKSLGKVILRSSTRMKLLLGFIGEFNKYLTATKGR